MTDDVKESAPEVQDAEEQPTQQPSVPSVDEPTSEPSLDVDKIASALEERLNIDDRIDRAFQSAKDRRFADVETIFKYFQEADGNETQAIRNMKIDGVFDDEQTTASNDSDGTGSADTAMQAVSTIVLEDAGIAFDDPSYNELVSKWAGKVQDPEHWKTVLSTWADRQTSKAAKASGSVTEATVASSSGAAASGDTVEALSEELNNLMEGGGDKPLTHPDNIKRIGELRAKLKELES